MFDVYAYFRRGGRSGHIGPIWNRGQLEFASRRLEPGDTRESSGEQTHLRSMSVDEHFALELISQLISTDNWAGKKMQADKEGKGSPDFLRHHRQLIRWYGKVARNHSAVDQYRKVHSHLRLDPSFDGWSGGQARAESLFRDRQTHDAGLVPLCPRGLMSHSTPLTMDDLDVTEVRESYLQTRLD